MNRSHLTAIGLEPAQASVYLAVAERGPLLLTEIARATVIRRGDLYAVIPDMVACGLLVGVPQGKRLRYAAADPSVLERRIEARTRDLEAIRAEIKELAVRTDGGPRFTLRQGRAALRETFEAFMVRLRKDDVYLRFSSRRADTDFNKYVTDVYRAEDERKRPEHFVITNRAVAGQYVPKLGRAVKFLPEMAGKPFTHNVNAYVYQDRTLFVDYSSETVFEVQHGPFADFLRTIFKSLYDRL